MDSEDLGKANGNKHDGRARGMEETSEEEGITGSGAAADPEVRTA